MSERTVRRGRAKTRGNALVMALVLITVIAGLGVGFLQVTMSSTHRQAADVDRLQAFYLAEAGLAESFQAVRIGRSGQVASEAAPASYGNGLLWVDAVDTVDGNVRLTSTAVVDSGRASLSLLLEPISIPLGFFSDEELVVEDVLLVDGYDSGEATYDETVAIELGMTEPSIGEPPPEEPPSEIQLYTDFLVSKMGAAKLIDYLTMDAGAIVAREVARSTALTLDEANQFLNRYWDVRAAYEAGEAVIADPTVSTTETTLGETTLEETTSRTREALPSTSDWHTGSGGLLGSNGDVTFSSASGVPIEVYGDVVPGPGGTVGGVESVEVTGETAPRSELVELPPVEVVDVTLAPAVLHDGLLPLVISPGTSGHESIEVAADAELVLRGPATVVIGELVLQPGALLTMDTREGPVELFVTVALDLQAGSTVVTSEAPSDVSVQVAAIPTGTDGEEPVKLEATSRFHGTIYAPETDVHVGGSFEVFGGIVAKRLEVAPGARLHFDTAEYDVSGVPRIVAWRIVEIPAAVRGGGVFRFAEGDLVPLADAHDLESVELSVTFLDELGRLRSYTGLESHFDWSHVAEVVEVDRTATRVAETDLANDPPATSSSTTSTTTETSTKTRKHTRR